MGAPSTSQRSRKPSRGLFWLGTCVFAAIAVFFLWEEHQAHIMGALPYVLLLLCPAMHLLMHRGHGHHHDANAGARDGAHAPHERYGARP